MTRSRERKTVDASLVREKANHMLAVTPDSFKAQRQGIVMLAEALLMEAGAYKGFEFTDHRMLRDDTRRRFL